MPQITMTVERVKEILARIRESADDDEAAHTIEDALWETVLRSIADDACDDPAACARAALKSKEIEFCRWRV